MKLLLPVRILVIATANIFFSVSLCNGQTCSDGSSPKSISYDTLFRGGGNQNYQFGFPQFDTAYIFHFPLFDPSKGTLVRVDIQTLLSVEYKYELENTTNLSASPKVIMNRTDIFDCSALSAPEENDLFNKTVNTHTLSASDSIPNSGPDYVAIGPLYKYKNFPINKSFTNNLAGFLGNGKVDFNYETTTDLYPTGGSYSFNATITDSMYFKMTYYYCLNAILPASITNFTATRASSGNIQLNWLTPDDYAGKKYVVEKSTNGTDYTPFSTVVSNSNTGSNYLAWYTPVHADKSRLFFRIKVPEKNGMDTYSAIRDVNLPGNEESVMKVYPTIATDAVNIYFPAAVKGDYLVNIRAVTGQIIQQSKFKNSNYLKVSFNSKIPAGLYLVEAVNTKTQNSQQSKIIVQ